MKISTDVMTVHEHLSNCSIKFLEYVKEHPETLKRCNYSRFDGFVPSITVVQPWPVFINQHTRREIEETVVNVYKLIKCIPHRLFGNDPDKISQYYDFPLELVQLQLTGTRDEHIKNLMGRGDFVFTPGGLKCLECNASANVGGWHTTISREIYLRTPLISSFLEKNRVKIQHRNLIHLLCEHLIDSALERFPAAPEINSLIVMPGHARYSQIALIETYLKNIYQSILQLKTGTKNGSGNCWIADYTSPHLKIEKNRVLFQGQPVHNLVEKYNIVAPLEILEAYQAGNLVLYNGPVRFLLGSKLNLALLSEHENSYLFSPEEREVIKKHIPWTRAVVNTQSETTYGGKTVGLKDFILDRREELVLKPADGFSGDNIHIGRHTPENRWRDLIESVLKADSRINGRKTSLNHLEVPLKDWEHDKANTLGIKTCQWVVQEYLESSPYIFQVGQEGYAEHNVVWGLFIWGSTYSGGFLRLLSKKHDKGIINCSQGAEESIILEVEE